MLTNRLTRCAPLILLFGGCLDGGSIKIVGDSRLGLDGLAVATDGAPSGQDYRIITPDNGGGTLDTGGAPKPDGKVKLDAAAPTGPSAPFGSTVGVTAANFVDIPDCKGTKHSLHPLFRKYKGVVIAMMSPS